MIHRMHAPAVNLAGETSLITMAALLEQAQAVVTTDAGPMHIAAAAMQTPVVALFGPTAPWRTGPFGDHHQLVSAGRSCAPCFKRSCQTRACMQAIQPQQVFSTLEMLLCGRQITGNRT
jgi:heptosyltransferase-1